MLWPNISAHWPAAMEAPKLRRTAIAASDVTVASGLGLLLLLAGVKLGVHLVCAQRYGFFRDELYYLACAQHLAWGYVDQPPFIALVAGFSRSLLGGSLLSVRIPAVVAGALVVFVTGWMARELGGGKFAQFLAALAVLIAPAYLAFDSFLSMNAFEPLFWTAAALILIRVVKTGNSHWWLLFGAICGFALLNKHSTLLFGFAIFLGLLLTPARRHLCNRWIWLGGLIALLIFLPNLLWEMRHHWPQIEVVRNAQRFKNMPLTPGQFLLEQVLFLQPITLPLWLAGLAWYFSRVGKRFRALGWTFLIILGVFLALKGKSYYPLPAYPLLFSAGGVAIESFLRPHKSVVLKFACPCILLLGGALTLPFGLPVLSVDDFLRYQQAVPVARQVQTERGSVGPLPQLYADMFGWQGMVATIARVYNGLTPQERAQCAIFAGNYGEAGAIDYFGGAYGLPRALSGHNTYFLWGPRGYSGQVVIVFGREAEPLKQYFQDVRQVAVISNPYAMAIENNVPVYICRRPLAPLREIWPHVRLII